MTEIERPCPESWRVEGPHRSSREAGHATVAVLPGGWRVVSRSGSMAPTTGFLGSSKSILEHDPSMADLSSALLSALAGPHGEGRLSSSPGG